MKPITRGIVTATAACLLLSACGRNLSSDVYTSSSTVGKVVYGTIVSSRQVTVKDNDRLGSNGTGVLGGGVAGGTLGSALGHGRGRGVSTVGGAIAGAVLGAVIEDQLSTTQGVEYIVRLDATPQPAPVERKQTSFTAGGAIDSDIKQSIQMAEIQTQTISIIQTDKIMLPPGQRVMVVYNNDRPRVTAIQ